jgi:hypothetical protein
MPIRAHPIILGKALAARTLDLKQAKALLDELRA